MIGAVDFLIAIKQQIRTRLRVSRIRETEEEEGASKLEFAIHCNSDKQHTFTVLN